MVSHKEGLYMFKVETFYSELLGSVGTHTHTHTHTHIQPACIYDGCCLV